MEGSQSISLFTTQALQILCQQQKCVCEPFAYNLGHKGNKMTADPRHGIFGVHSPYPTPQYMLYNNPIIPHLQVLPVYVRSVGLHEGRLQTALMG